MPSVAILRDRQWCYGARLGCVLVVSRLCLGGISRGGLGGVSVVVSVVVSWWYLGGVCRGPGCVLVVSLNGISVVSWWYL